MLVKQFKVLVSVIRDGVSSLLSQRNNGLFLSFIYLFIYLLSLFIFLDDCPRIGITANLFQWSSDDNNNNNNNNKHKCNPFEAMIIL